RVLDWKVIAQGAHAAEATIKIDLGGRAVHTAAEGCGPVAALDAALRKALFPAAEAMRLADYKVRILDGRDGTGAVTRVLVDTTDGVRSWSTVGAAPSILDASIEALADGYEYGLVTLEKSVEKTMEEVA
ncbi:MAG: alpha-isopropylmalate synthase regulatory domain-containing protein, partial [Polyangiales bacterium]